MGILEFFTGGKPKKSRKSSSKKRSVRAEHRKMYHLWDTSNHDQLGSSKSYYRNKGYTKFKVTKFKSGGKQWYRLWGSGAD
jgi:hypothetical protein